MVRFSVALKSWAMGKNSTTGFQLSGDGAKISLHIVSHSIANFCGLLFIFWHNKPDF
jgi:hypothetical protein